MGMMIRVDLSLDCPLISIATYGYHYHSNKLIKLPFQHGLVVYLVRRLWFLEASVYLRERGNLVCTSNRSLPAQ